MANRVLATGFLLGTLLCAAPSVADFNPECLGRTCDDPDAGGGGGCSVVAGVRDDAAFGGWIMVAGLAALTARRRR